MTIFFTDASGNISSLFLINTKMLYRLSGTMPMTSDIDNRNPTTLFLKNPKPPQWCLSEDAVSSPSARA